MPTRTRGGDDRSSSPAPTAGRGHGVRRRRSRVGMVTRAPLVVLAAASLALFGSVAVAAAGQPGTGSQGIGSTPRVDLPPVPVPSLVPSASGLAPERPAASGTTICGAANGTWQSITTTIPSLEPSGFFAGQILQLTDGTIMVQDSSTGTWFRLHADSRGCYFNGSGQFDGSWTAMASMLPSGYAPTYYASAVLPDGKVVVVGGEYNGTGGGTTFTKQATIYNPVTNVWTPFATPSSGFGGGDLQSVILPDGQCMLGNTSPGCAFLLNEPRLTWTPTGCNKSDQDMDEEGWNLLPDGNVLTYDLTWVGNGFNSLDHSLVEIYSPSTGDWSTDGYTPVILANGCSPVGSHTLSLAECGQQQAQSDGFQRSDQPIGFDYLVTNRGTTEITGISVASSLTFPSCPSSTLAPGATMTCIGTYTTTAANVSAKAFTDTATATGATTSGPLVSGGTSVTESLDCNCYNSAETGAQALRPNGTLFATGASGYNALYNTSSNSWSASQAFNFPITLSTVTTGPETDQQYSEIDGPSVVLPDGDVLAEGGAGVHPPLHFFDFNGSSLKQIANDAPGSSSFHSDEGNYLMDLPTGQILAQTDGLLAVYTDTGLPQSSWAPTISDVPASLAPGGRYALSGTQLNGLTQGGAFGDDEQDATNFPLVKILNLATGDVVFARTYSRTLGQSNRSIAPGDRSSTEFSVPSGTPAGASEIEVVANGISSAPVTVTVS